MSRRVWIVGASMTRFGRWPAEDAMSLGATAAAAAVDDAGIAWHDIGMLAAACALDVLPAGQRIQKHLVQTGIPSSTSPTRARAAPPPSASPTWRSPAARSTPP